MKDNERIYEENRFVFYEKDEGKTKVNLTVVFGKGYEPKTVEGLKKYFLKWETL